MTILRCIKIEMGFGDLEVLKGISLEISAGEKIGLVGNNGAGKSTLANIIAGEIEPLGGEVVKFRPLQIGYLRQATSYTLNVFNQMVTGQGEGQGFMEMASLLGLRQVKRWDEGRFSGLSGGERTKLALSHVLSSNPDLLILDEPTNHMDFHGVEWLIGELKGFSGAVLVISHDRFFLDQVVGRIYEVENGLVTQYPGNYSFYRDQKRKQRESQMHQYLSEQKEQRKIQEEINRLKNWSSKSHREAGKTGKASEMRAGVKEYGRMQAKKKDKQIKSRIKLLQKKQREGTGRPQEEEKPEFDFNSSGNRGKRIIEATGLGKSLGDLRLFQDSDFFIQRGEKIGIIGTNGCGKTTLLRMIQGLETVESGQLWVSPSLKPGYLSQDVTDMSEAKNVLEYLGFTEKTMLTRARTLLANMGFDADMVQKPLGKLSLGERTRVKLASMILKENDLLILDEPTNHLDLHSRERLEETLLEYRGTILLVSHDRYLLERVCEKLLVFEDGKIIKELIGFGELRTKEIDSGPREDLTVIETKMAWVLGQLGTLSPEDSRYQELDQEFKDLAAKKRELI